MPQPTPDSRLSRNSATFEVHASNYKSRFQRGPDGLVWFDRTHHFANPSIETDVTGRNWCFGILKPGYVFSPLKHGKLLTIPDGAAVFFPSFSIVQWHVGAGLSKFRVYLSCQPIPSQLISFRNPEEPFCFSMAHDSLPITHLDIFSLIEKSKDPIDIGLEETNSAVAHRTKQLIDKTFTEDLSLVEIGARLGYSHSIMTRAFKKCYKISPVKYRNKLRIFESLNLMAIRGQGAALTAADVGFHDLSHFNKTFRKMVHAVPSQFRAPWKGR